MAEDSGEVEFVGNSRERGSRTSLVDTARFAGDYQSQQDGSLNTAGDETGYWDGAEYKTYFRFGVSKFGGKDVFK